MKVDLYTKAVLTVIAVCLCIIAFRSTPWVSEDVFPSLRNHFRRDLLIVIDALPNILTLLGIGGWEETAFEPVDNSVPKAFFA